MGLGVTIGGFPVTLGVLDLLRQAGALRPGHTALQGGAHTDGWIDKGAVMRDPGTLDEVALLQAGQLRRAWPDATLLVGLPACGAVLASFVGRHLRWPVAYLLDDEEVTWHRMHVPAAPQQVVIVDDVISTGRGVRRAAAFLRTQGHVVLGASAWVCRAELAELDVVAMTPPPYRTVGAPECPDCAQGQAVVHVGVRE